MRDVKNAAVMEVSTFELQIKPTLQNGTSVAQSEKQIVQGYYLTISNLETIDLTFELDIFVSPSSSQTPRNLHKDLELLVETAGRGQKISLLDGPIFGENRCLGLFRIPAEQTATVALMPKSITEPLVAQNLEIKGYTELRVPQLPFCSFPQSKNPVKVQLKPEVRRILQNGFGAGREFEVRCPLALSSDRAFNELEAEANTLRSSEAASEMIGYLLRKIENFELTEADLQALAGDNQDKVLQMVELASEIGCAEADIDELLAELDALEVAV